MPRCRLLLLLFLCGHLGPLSNPAPSAEQPPAGADSLRLGMSPKQVRDILGEPMNVSRRIILNRTHEQWHYNKLRLRLSFDHPRGASAVLVRISPTERKD